MVDIVICVGSSCHVRGAEKLAEIFQQLIVQYGLAARVELTGAFCMECCSMDVSVRIGERTHRVPAASAEAFFEHEILPWARGRVTS